MMDWGLYHPLCQLLADLPTDYLTVKVFLLPPFLYYHLFITYFKLSTNIPASLACQLCYRTIQILCYFHIPNFLSGLI